MPKKILPIILLMFSCMQLHNLQAQGNYCRDEFCCLSSDWYGIIGAGYAWSMNTGIENPDTSFWDPAIEGYNANLGNSPFITIGVGKTFCNMFCFDVGYSYYQTFHYQKFQTGTADTMGFTGSSRTRFFDLDHMNVLANFSYYSTCFAYDFCFARFTPFVGAGIGLGINRVSNFHTVGLTNNVGSTTSIGRATTKTSFAWQATGGIEIRPTCSALSIDIGYHYYDGGRFEGPSLILSNTLGTAQNGSPWKGRLKANEVFLTLNFHI